MKKVIRIDFLGDEAAPKIDLSQLFINKDEISLFRSYSRSGQEKLVYASVVMEILEQKLSVSAYQRMLGTISLQTNNIAINTALAISEAIEDKELLDQYIDWDKVTLSDFSLVVNITLNDSNEPIVTPNSFYLVMRAPQKQLTCDLPFDDASTLPRKLIEWLGEMARIRLKPRD